MRLNETKRSAPQMQLEAYVVKELTAGADHNHFVRYVAEKSGQSWNESVGDAKFYGLKFSVLFLQPDDLARDS